MTQLWSEHPYLRYFYGQLDSHFLLVEFIFVGCYQNVIELIIVVIC